MKKIIDIGMKSDSELTITYNELFIHASGEYLTEYLPTNYDSMADDEFNEFIEDYKTESLEYTETGTLVDMICTSADALSRLFESKGFKVLK